MKRALILDFDGPLFPERVIKYDPRNGNSPLVQEFVRLNTVEGTIANSIIGYCYMDMVVVGMLNRLYKDLPYKIVVSSSWKDVCEKNTIEAMFKLNGVEAPFHKDWCTTKQGRFSATRIHEVGWWIDDHKDTDYFIIDDPWSFPQIIDDHLLNEMGYDLDRVLCVDPMIGIDIEGIEKVYNAWTFKR